MISSDSDQLKNKQIILKVETMMHLESAVEVEPFVRSEEHTSELQSQRSISVVEIGRASCRERV